MNILNVLIIYLGITSAVILVFIGLSVFYCWDINDFKHEVKRLVPRIFVVTLLLYLAATTSITTIKYFNGVYIGN